MERLQSIVVCWRISKTAGMKQKTANHEVLLFTTSSFSKKQYAGNDGGQPANSLAGQPQTACWTGLIFEILPAMSEYPSERKKYYVWEMTAGRNFISVKIGAAPCSADDGRSVNPYFSLLEKIFN